MTIPRIEGGERERTELQVMKAGAAEVPAAVVFAYTKTAEIKDQLKAKVDEAVASGRYTDAGLQSMFAAWAEEAVLYAGRFDLKAARIETQHGQSVDAEMNRLSLPEPDVVKTMMRHQLQEVLSKVDPVYLEQILLTAAKRGNDQDEALLRAALTFPRPPFDMPGWPTLVSTGLLSGIRAAIAERFSPQGEAAWEAQSFRTMAARLRRAAGVDDLAVKATGVDPFAHAGAAAADERRWLGHPNLG